jgi:hypothetical protein
MKNIIGQPVLNFLTKEECSDIINNRCDLENLKLKLINCIKDYFITDFKGYELDEITNIELNSYTVNQKYFNFQKIDNEFLSFMIQLNEDYDEGFFQFLVKDDTEYYQFYSGAGHMILFFSSLKHRTIPVKSGIKYTLTGNIILKQIDNYTKTII